MMLERNETLTTISGNLKRFEVTYVGQEDVKIRGTMSPAQHFRLSGEFERISGTTRTISSFEFSSKPPMALPSPTS